MSDDADVLAAVNVANFPDGGPVVLEAILGNSITYDNDGKAVAAGVMMQVGCCPPVLLLSLFPPTREVYRVGLPCFLPSFFPSFRPAFARKRARGRLSPFLPLPPRHIPLDILRSQLSPALQRCRGRSFRSRSPLLSLLVHRFYRPEFAAPIAARRPLPPPLDANNGGRQSYGLSTDDEAELESAAEWELELQNFFGDEAGAIREEDGVNVVYFTSRSLDDALGESVSGEIFLFGTTCEDGISKRDRERETERQEMRLLGARRVGDVVERKCLGSQFWWWYVCVCVCGVCSLGCRVQLHVQMNAAPGPTLLGTDGMCSYFHTISTAPSAWGTSGCCLLWRLLCLGCNSSLFPHETVHRDSSTFADSPTVEISRGRFEKDRPPCRRCFCFLVLPSSPAFALFFRFLVLLGSPDPIPPIPS